MSLRDRWEQMASCEKDALVAEKVMGWKYDPVYHWGPGRYDCPGFSSEVEDAFRVVEKMREKRMEYRFADQLVEVLGLKSRGEQLDSRDLFLIANASPDQRCLAALLALGVE